MKIKMQTDFLADTMHHLIHSLFINEPM